ncbi:helix-turn-helix domain-containing protein [Agarivorans sp. DSG3-1]|uniref:helix-turn-helix domain-containing protein n=1 Tax=Agarivorans sp. DSG3-1 TaxID=3342249 RepID=UPI00398F1349
MEKGYSQPDLLMIIGVCQQQISRIEKGADVKLSNLIRVLEGYGLEWQCAPQGTACQLEASC